MRLWSIHPRFLDDKWLVALWREWLLAKNVLEGKTSWYKNHPQLNRFKKTNNPLKYINEYLYEVFLESKNRNYNFDVSKIKHYPNLQKLTVTKWQFKYEIIHLKKKLLARNPKKLEEIESLNEINPHPLFIIIEGEIEDWEILAKHS